MAQAQAVYRNVLRSAQLAFQGDAALLAAAKQQLRDEFRKNASLQPNDPALAAAIEHAQGVAQILRANIVQGKHEGDNKYRLRIHEDTERGDNDTIKMPGGQIVTIDGKKCTDA